MPFIIEDGTGHSQANAYASVAYVLNYLTERNRQDENGWADLDLNVRQANIIAATDYIDKRFGKCFKGQKEFESLTQAVGVLTFTGIPISTETVTIGSRVYTYRGALTGADDVLVGTSIKACIDNLINAIGGGEGEGTTYGTGTVPHADVFVEPFESDQMVCHENDGGTVGNSIATLTTVTGATWTNTTLTGGTEVGRPQPLQFPRVVLYDPDGFLVVGMPDKLLQSTSEYAVRAAAAVLQPDPDVTTGLQLIETDEKVDVLQEKKKYSDGGRVQISIPYPAADGLLTEYLQITGLVLRA